jgi:hypothetical protein
VSVDHWPGRPEGHGPVKIVHACGLLAWQALGAQSGGDCVSLRGGSLGEIWRAYGAHPGGAEEWVGESEILQPVVQSPGAYGAGLAMQRQLFF